MLTHERLLELLSYDPATGSFTWRAESPRSGVRAGAEAGTKTKRGYVYIGIDGKRYLRHRLAWFYVHGTWPDFVDHKFGVKGDDRITEIRDVSRTGNQQNIRKPQRNNSSGVLGVSWNKATESWRVQVQAAGWPAHVGLFNDLQDAAVAQLTARRERHATNTL